MSLAVSWEPASMDDPDSDLTLLAAFFHSAHYHLWQALRLAESAGDAGGAEWENIMVLIFAHPLRLEELAVTERTTPELVARSLAELRRRGLADEAKDGRWTATPNARELVERRRATRVEKLTAGLKQLSRDEVESLLHGY